MISGKKSIIGGLALEELLKNRNKSSLFEKTPDSVAFIQCVGSRDKKEESHYCSRVCCGYSTRAAKLIVQMYPECKITFLYMEMQAVSGGDYFSSLEKGSGFEFIKCRPLKITGGQRVSVEYEEPAEGILKKREFDFVCLAEGIHPSLDADITAELCGLSQDKAGFFKEGNDGIFIAGCAKGPYKIEEAWSDSVAVAKQILGEM